MISRHANAKYIVVDKKQLDTLEYFKYFCSLITNYVRCKCEIKSMIVTAKAEFKKKKKKTISAADLT